MSLTASAAVAVLASVGCGRAEADREAATARVEPVATSATGSPSAEAPQRTHTPAINGEGYNVILVSVDTTRADHIGCYGHPVIETPNIDRLAAEGTRFAWCISSAPLTLPSHTTMLTGSYPFVHGARDNAIFDVNQENVTLAELFKEAGYATHAEVAAAVLDAKYGLEQGFDTYGDVDLHKPKINMRLVDREGRVHEAPHVPTEPDIELDTPDIEVDRKAGQITDRGIELLQDKARTGERFFMFLHYFDPHWPHEAPEHFVEKFEDGYFAEIAYFDEQFGRLVDAVRDLGLAGKTLVILTSDHGEGRGDHGEYTHSAFLYDSTLHVPLIAWCPGKVPASQVVEQQVRVADIAPTIADFARLRFTDQMQGASVLPLMVDPDRDERRPVYADTMVPKNNFGYSPLRALRADGWKYILAPQSELYRVEEDTHELFNVVEVEADRADRMKEELRDLIADSPLPPGGRGTMRSLDETEMRRLAALGYVSSKALADPGLRSASELDYFEPQGLNPKDRAEVVEAWASGLGAFRVGEYELAEVLFKRFVELEPEIATGPSYLGRTCMMLERYDEAIEYLRKAVELEPGGFIDYRALGNLMAMRGEYQQAADYYSKVLELRPDDSVANLNLGMIRSSERRFDEALALFDAGLEAAPEEPPLHLQKGICLRMSGRPQEALESLERAIELEPALPLAYVHAAAIRFQLGEPDNAIQELEQAAEVTPDDPLVHQKLAEFHGAQHHRERAGEAFARVAELMPENAMARQNLGSSLLNRGQYDAAMTEFRKALELEPRLLLARFNLGVALEAAGRLDEAIATYREVLDAAPRHVGAYGRAAEAMSRSGDLTGAIELLRSAYSLMPENVLIANDLAWRLATAPDPAARNGAEAVELAEFAAAQTGAESCNELDTLAAAYAEAGRFDDAVATAERALALAHDRQPDLVESISTRLDLYRQGRPYRMQ